MPSHPGRGSRAGHGELQESSSGKRGGSGIGEAAKVKLSAERGIIAAIWKDDGKTPPPQPQRCCFQGENGACGDRGEKAPIELGLCPAVINRTMRYADRFAHGSFPISGDTAIV